MCAATPIFPAKPRENHFSSEDVKAILREHEWLAADADKSERLKLWLKRAAFLLGPQATDRDALADLLGLVFNYNSAAILREQANHAVLGREGSRAVIRELALAVLEGTLIDSERFKAIVNIIRNKVPYSSRELFHPLRLALAGRAGGGELDRVILLLDDATEIPGLAPLKGTRQRILEFCAALE